MTSLTSNLRLTGIAALLLTGTMLHAQGILTVTPGPAVTTVAGTGAPGYSGDNGTASSATLASPSAVAYDSAGDIFIADAANHVVREISITGVITTIAGTGIQGYSGDGGPATAALLDTPTGVAVDSSGNIYIADSHNNCIREVSGTTISTIAGTGVAGFSGDGAAATLAQLADPVAVAVDSNGNVYIADSNNQRIRKITGTTISTVAGDGEQTFAGDGSAATSAVLDSPTGVAVDSSFNLYIADRHNQRIRMVTPGGTISTLAGSGSASFSGSFAGDGGSAASASLAKPSGVSVDAAGNIYIADTGNQRIREVTAGGSAINTFIGSGQQGFGEDTSAPSGTNLNMPKAVAVSTTGSVVVADKLNELVRVTLPPALAFGTDSVGINSAPQAVTLANTGSASITVSSAAFSGPFTAVAGGTCSAAPITLAAGASCTQNVAFLPSTVGSVSGSVVYSGPAVVPNTILLSGAGSQATAAISLATTAAVLLTGQSVTMTATVMPTGTGTPTGTVSFLNGANIVGSPVALGAGGIAVFTSTHMPAGNDAMTAVYSGDTNFSSSTSSAVSELVEDFSFSAASTGGSASQTVAPGQVATFNFNMSPTNSAFDYPVTLSATGLPPGATATFSPSTLTLGPAATPFTLSIQAPAQALLEPQPGFELGKFNKGALSIALLLLPFSLLHKNRRIRPLLMAMLVLIGSGATLGLTGCSGGGGGSGGSGSSSSAPTQQTYTITVTGTATGATGTTLQHSTIVTLTVE